MKRLTGWILLLILLICSAVPALAVDESRSYSFDLAVNGQNEVHVLPDQVVTVTFTLNRLDSAAPYTMYAMQNQIRYDDTFVEIVEEGTLVNADIQTRDIALRGDGREFYMNYVSFADGVTWNAKQIVGNFQLRIKGTSGATVLSNKNYKVSLADGSDVYAAQAGDLTLIVSSECIVRFVTNGGSPMEDMIVPYGELMPVPEPPVREGYHVAGWYSDIDLTQEWDFATMPVVSNMTLYARWEEGGTESGSDTGLLQRIAAWFRNLIHWFRNLFAGIGNASNGGMGDMLVLVCIAAAALVLLLLVILLLLRRRKCTVIFVVQGGVPVEPIRVKRGQTLKNLPVPVRGYSVFCGWYKDEKMTDPWYAGVDKVTKRTTRLYAKWL